MFARQLSRLIEDSNDISDASQSISILFASKWFKTVILGLLHVFKMIEFDDFDLIFTSVT